MFVVLHCDGFRCLLSLELLFCPLFNFLFHDQYKTFGTVLILCWKYLEIIRWNNVLVQGRELYLRGLGEGC